MTGEAPVVETSTTAASVRGAADSLRGTGSKPGRCASGRPFAERARTDAVRAFPLHSRQGAR